LSYEFLIKEFKYYEYLICVMLAIFGLFLFMSGANFLYVFLGLELQAMSFYIIFSTFCKNNISYEAALKYFILNIFISGIMLLGISLIYGYCGTVYFCELGLLMSKDIVEIEVFSLYNLGIFLFLIGVCFKLALVPFHY
jgi:NADH-quinone oxidoreductase subunit N